MLVIIMSNYFGINRASFSIFVMIKDIHCFRTDLQEEIITDNEIHSDLDPLEAPAWSVGVQFEDLPQCLLSKSYFIFLLKTYNFNLPFPVYVMFVSSKTLNNKKCSTLKSFCAKASNFLTNFKLFERRKPIY